MTSPPQTLPHLLKHNNNKPAISIHSKSLPNFLVVKINNLRGNVRNLIHNNVRISWNVLDHFSIKCAVMEWMGNSNKVDVAHNFHQHNKNNLVAKIKTLIIINKNHNIILVSNNNNSKHLNKSNNKTIVSNQICYKLLAP